MILFIPADNIGGKLLLKDYREEGTQEFVKYRSTYNNIPFIETEIFITDDKKDYVITSDNGTVMWRFSVEWIEKLK